MKRVWWIAGGIALGLVVASCGGDDGEAGVTQADSPLQQALGLDFSDPSSFAEQNETAFAEAAEQAVECMRAAGFEYIPQTVQIIPDNPSAVQTEGLSAKEYAEQFGWGVTTLFGPDQDEFFGGSFSDPNDDYVNSLSIAERNAYYAALYGDFSSFDPGVDDTEQSLEEFEPSGCEGLAFEAAFNGEDSAFSVFEEFGDELGRLEETYQADPRIVEFDRAWSACIGEAGFDYDTPNEAQEDMFGWMDAVYQNIEFPGIDINEQDIAALSEEELTALFNQPPDFDQDLLDSIRADESELAVASLDCDYPPPPVEQPQVYLVVRFELEQEFVDAHADAFPNAG